MIINLDSMPILHPTKGFNFVDVSTNVNLNNTDTDEYVIPLYAGENNKSFYSSNYNLYVICVLTGNLDFKLTSVIPSDILEKIYAKEVILTIDHSPEAYVGIVNDIYKHFIIEQGVPESQILLVLNTPEHKDYIINKAKSLNLEPIRYECFHPMMKLIQRQFTMEYSKDDGYKPPLIPNTKSSLLRENFNKKFISFNRIPRPHRVMLFLMLYQKNLLNQGYYGFVKPPGFVWGTSISQTKQKFSNSEFEQYFNNEGHAYNLLPLKIDNTDPTNAKTLAGYNTGHIKLYNDSYFSIVGESEFFDTDNKLHITEKTFVPMLRKHPFIILAPAHFLKYVRELGFKTYDGAIDESYDDETDDQKRLLKIVAEIERLCNLTPTELTDFREKALPVVEHNFKVLMETKQFTQKIL